MLTVRLQQCPGQPPVLLGGVSFHSLSTEPTAYPHTGGLTALGLLVRASAAASLMGPATGALVNQVVDWGTLVGRGESHRLEAALLSRGSDLDRLQALLASFCRAMAAQARNRHADLARLCSALEGHGAHAGEQLGIGRRQLERRSQALLGVSPKQFQRLVRLQRSLGLATQATPGQLAQVALEAGYFDQAHMARDVRRLAGQPLGPLVSQARPHAAWWPLATRCALPVAPALHLAGG